VCVNISISHSRSLKIIRNYTLELGVCESPVVFHCTYVCISYHLNISYFEIFSVN